MRTFQPELGFGIVGTGVVAALHTLSIKEMEGVALRAVSNRSSKKAVAFSEKFPAEVESDLDALLRRPDSDIVCVATPSGRMKKSSSRTGKSGTIPT